VELEWGREEPGAKVQKSGVKVRQGQGLRRCVLKWRDAERGDGRGLLE